MFPHQDTIYRNTVARQQQYLAEAAVERLALQARAKRRRQPALVVAVKRAVGSALISFGQRIRGASLPESEMSNGVAVDSVGAAR